MSQLVQMLTRFENGSNLNPLTVTILNNGTLGGISGGAWELTETPSADLSVATAAEVTVSGFNVSGLGNSDLSSTRGVRCYNAGVTATRRIAKYRFLGNPQGKVSFGCAIKLGAGLVSGSDSSFDFFSIEGISGEFFCLNYADSAVGGPKWNAHTQAGKSAGTTVESDHWYWITMLWDSDGTLATLKTYDIENNYNLIGTETIALFNQDAYSVCVGRYDGISASSADDYTYYDDLAVDFSGLVYPLLPELGLELAVGNLGLQTFLIG
jgi:hypothetical protein